MNVKPETSPEWERERLQQARKGDLEAFGDLVEAYSPPLLSLAWRILGNREDAWDAVQDGLALAWKNLSGYREECGFYYWARVIVTRVALRMVRKRRREEAYRSGEQLDDRLLLEGGRDPSQEALQSLESEQVWNAVRTLPALLRTVFWLREGEGLSYDEIAAALEVPVGTVRSRLFEARRKLRDMLGGMVGETSGG